ncbi:MAG: sortase [Patescibacteria group bacterium]
MNDLFDQVWAEKWRFFAVFFIIFTVSYLVLMALDWLPETPSTERESTEVITATSTTATSSAASEAVATSRASATTSEAVNETGSPAVSTTTAPTAVALGDGVTVPRSLHIPRLGRTVQVLNPTSRTVADLDAALLEGVVRHPDSARLDQEGNVFVLGHSSYLPQVMNRNFQAFNGIQDLEWGDTLELHTPEAVYAYRVDRVYEARATEVTVPIAGTGHKLTLATCDSFGSVDDRYIVEASRVAVTAKDPA